MGSPGNNATWWRSCSLYQWWLLLVAAFVVALLLASRVPTFNSALLSFLTSFLYGAKKTSPTLGQAEDASAHLRAALRTGWAKDGRTKSGKLSRLAQRIYDSQHPQTCSTAKFATFTFQGSAGLGVNILAFTDVLCETAMRGVVLVTKGPWHWRDASFCGSDLTPGLRRTFNLADMYPGGQTATECYFGRETHCAVPSGELDETYLYDNGLSVYQALFDPTARYRMSHKTRLHAKRDDLFTRHGGGPYPDACKSIAKRHAAGLELLFQTLPPAMLEAIERWNARIFGEHGAPANMVTVHLRWSDKVKEAGRIGIAPFIDAIHSLIHKHNLHPHLTVFVMTEDPAALDAFRKAAPPNWTVKFHNAAVYHGDTFMQSSFTAGAGANTGGALGLHSLVALVLGLEARFFVLTATSNWSRMFDQIRAFKHDFPGCTPLKAGNCSETINIK